ncbi:MAG: CHASE3 domain-containing protein [Usitatibacter sp.]
MEATVSSHERLTLAGFAAAALAVIGLAAAAYWVSEQQTLAASWVAHTHEVRAIIARARAAVIDLQNTQRGYAITGQDRDLEGYRAAATELETELPRLLSLTSDNPSQGARLSELASAIDQRLAGSRDIVEARRKRGAEAARSMIEADLPHEQMARIRGMFDALDGEENRLLERRLADQQSKLALFWLTTGLLVSALLVALGVIYSMVRRRNTEQSALLRSEHRFHLMTQSVVDYAILMLDTEGRVVSWNAGAERIKGYREDEILGEHFSRFYPQADLERGKPRAELEIAAAKGRFEDEGWRLRKDGSRFWANVVITALRDASGALRGYAKVTRDLSERKRAEDALREEVVQRRRVEADLQELNRSLESLVAARTSELTGANAELRDAKERLEALSSRLITAQEEERRRISRELHDETGQALTGIRLRLKDALRNDGEHARRIDECLVIVDQAVKQIRSLAVNLRPPMLDDLGLKEALEWALEQQSKAAGWRASLDVGPFTQRLGPEVETACFRIGQEALTNAARYAGASEVRVGLRIVGGAVELTVSDNGCGFDPNAFLSREERKKHFGLVSMRERAGLVGGMLEVESSRGKGTRIRAMLPITAAA